MSERFEMGGGGCLHSAAAASLEMNSLLGMNNFRPTVDQSHVAQQSRREKLRVPQQQQQPSSTPNNNTNQIQDFSNNHHHHHLFQLPIRSSYSSLNPAAAAADLGQVRSSSIKSCGSSDLLFDPTTAAIFTSEMLNYSGSSNSSQPQQHVLLADHKDVVMNQESSGGGGPHQSAGRCGGPADNASAVSVAVASFGNSSHIVPTNFRFQSQQQSFDWMSNFVNGSSNGGGRTGGGGGGGDVCSSHENPSSSSSILIGETLPPPPPRNAKDETDYSYLKPGGGNCNEYQDVQQSSLTSNNNNRSSSEISNQADGHKSYGGEINFRSPLYYQTNLQHQQLVMTSSSSASTLGRQGLEMASVLVQQQQQKTREMGHHGSWADDGGGNELVLLPTNYVNQNDPSQLMDGGGGGSSSTTHQWNGDQVDFATNKINGSGNLENVVGDSNHPQGLALSLCSNPPPEFRAPHGQFGERFGSENMQTTRTAAGICGGNSDQDVKPNNSAGYLVSSSKPIISVNKSYGNTVENIGGCSTYARQGTGPLGPFTGYATILKNSRFLKPAKQLLEEFCNVNGASKACEVASDNRSIGDSSNLSDPGSYDNGDGRRGDQNSGVSSSFFSSNAAGSEGRVNSNGACQSYRPDFQQKKAKLMYMLEEVCRRYKQYHQQMQMVVSSFESVAGLDAATPYTSNALKTISSHFRSLKSTIADQLRLMKKALGEDLSSPPSVTNSSKGDATVPRLRFISPSLGKQAASGNSLGFLEQQQQVWRPQRGLPERSVAVLRSWLFEHFLHPYPTDTDKNMLASQTGLTRNQVSNWFINARVRIWKPMVEEMHMLESKGSTEMDISTSMNNQKAVAENNSRNTIEQSYNRHMTNAISEKAPDCSTARLASIVEVGQSSEQWHQEKRSRTDCQIQTGILDNGLMGLVPYHQSGLDVGGLGSVSLTLGLRHGTGNAQQQQRQDHQLSRHFGSHMVHDFVG